MEFFADVVLGLLLVSATYAATNLDNLLLLAAFASSGGSRAAVASGHAVAVVLVLALCGAFVSLSSWMTPGALSLLGVVPLVLGLRQLFGTAAGADSGAGRAAGSGAGAIAVTLAANSLDSVAAMGPLYAESEPVVVVTLLAGHVTMAAIWLLLALTLAAPLRRSPALHRVAGRVAPLVMIAIGLYILADTSTDLE